MNIQEKREESVSRKHGSFTFNLATVVLIFLNV